TITGALAGIYAKDHAMVPVEATVPQRAADYECQPLIDKYPTGEVFFRGDATAPYVYLTIDDGWDQTAVQGALDIARQQGISLTFFPVGKAMLEAPDLWR